MADAVSLLRLLDGCLARSGFSRRSGPSVGLAAREEPAAPGRRAAFLRAKTTVQFKPSSKFNPVVGAARAEIERKSARRTRASGEAALNMREIVRTFHTSRARLSTPPRLHEGARDRGRPTSIARGISRPADDDLEDHRAVELRVRTPAQPVAQPNADDGAHETMRG